MEMISFTETTWISVSLLVPLRFVSAILLTLSDNIIWAFEIVLIDSSSLCIVSQGLVVPVIRDADKMNFADIEKTINGLAKKATEGTISIDEMAGGSFTVSNGGVYGSLISTPIINPPQVRFDPCNTKNQSKKGVFLFVCY